MIPDTRPLTELSVVEVMHALRDPAWLMVVDGTSCLCNPKPIDLTGGLQYDLPSCFLNLSGTEVS